jgi:NADPH:quinone reductase-like Zn-dependent oxidoreductase
VSSARCASNGKGCSSFRIGDRLACLSKYEGQAELINLPEKYLIPVPEGVDAKAAVALILDWVTAYEMLHRAAHVKPGDRIFVHALSGAVGGALLRLGRLHGTQIFGTASSKKHYELRKLGSVPFDYSNKDWIAAIHTNASSRAIRKGVVDRYHGMTQAG